MKYNTTIKDQKQLDLIERLRGEKTAKEFVSLCLDAGFKLAELQDLQKQGKLPAQGGQLMKFSGTKPEFSRLDVAAITGALKEKDPKNPVVLEVGRLVKSYTSELRGYAEKNGNRLPKKMQVNARTPIEKLAFQITVQAINDIVKNAKTAAAK